MRVQPLSDRIRNFVFGICLLTAVIEGTAWAEEGEVRSAQGMVAADNVLASQIGIQIMQSGGNAADVAVATVLVLGVVHPHSSGLGGGGFVLYYDRISEEVTVLDFRERAPLAARGDMFLSEGGVDADRERHSGQSVGIPGEIAGLHALHQRFGVLPWEALFQPAIELAEVGFVVGPDLDRAIRQYSDEFSERPQLLQQFTGEEGRLVSEGDLLRRPLLAETLRRLAQEGPAGFYNGPVAEAIVRGTGGAITLEDLDNYQVRAREPLSRDYRGLTFYTMPPPSSGGVTMLQILSVLEGFNLSEMSPSSDAYFHLLAEAMQFGFADRAVYLGDPDFTDVPLEALMDTDLALERRERFDVERTLARDAYGMPRPGIQGEDLLLPPDDQGTSHLSVVDPSRNMLALTTTVNTWFGSLVVAGESGVILNNEMADFTAQVGVPNVFGLMGNEANAIAPGKTPLSSMSPTLVLNEGQPFMVAGASGGPRIISGTLQTILNVVEFGMSIGEAVVSQRVHHQWVPEQIYVEDAVPETVRSGLRERGHRVEVVDALGAVQAIIVSEEGLSGASDPRKGGHPAGF